MRVIAGCSVRTCCTCPRNNSSQCWAPSPSRATVISCVHNIGCCSGLPALLPWLPLSCEQILCSCFARLPKYMEFLEAVKDQRWKSRYVPVEVQSAGKDNKQYALSRDFYAQVGLDRDVCLLSFGQGAKLCSGANIVVLAVFAPCWGQVTWVAF